MLSVVKAQQMLQKRKHANNLFESWCSRRFANHRSIWQKKFGRCKRRLPEHFVSTGSTNPKFARGGWNVRCHGTFGFRTIWQHWSWQFGVAHRIRCFGLFGDPHVLGNLFVELFFANQHFVAGGQKQPNVAKTHICGQNVSIVVVLACCNAFFDLTNWDSVNANDVSQNMLCQTLGRTHGLPMVGELFGVMGRSDFVGGTGFAKWLLRKQFVVSGRLVIQTFLAIGS